MKRSTILSNPMPRLFDALVLVAALVTGLAHGGCGTHTLLGDPDTFSAVDSAPDVAFDADEDPDDDPDGDDVRECPSEMVLVPSLMVCIDRYESSEGVGGEALSMAGTLPWTRVSWDEAVAACEAAGKRLCTEDEWSTACRGPAGLRYPYGDDYEHHRCNGFDHEAGVAVPTGSMTGCEGGCPGLFDMSGNVWEWTASCSADLCRVRGGSFNRHEVGMRCSADLGFEPGERYAALGFRCCRTR